MKRMIDKEKEMEEYRALSKLLMDLIAHQKIVLRACFAVIILSIVVNAVIVGIFLWREAQWEYETTTTTTTTTEQATDGDDSDIINGNQYNKE